MAWGGAAATKRKLQSILQKVTKETKSAETTGSRFLCSLLFKFRGLKNARKNNMFKGSERTTRNSADRKRNRARPAVQGSTMIVSFPNQCILFVSFGCFVVQPSVFRGSTIGSGRSFTAECGDIPTPARQQEA